MTELENIPQSQLGIVFSKINEVECKQLPVKQPLLNEILIKVELASICGSEHRAIRGGKKGVNATEISPGNVLGHEGVGIVVKVGDAVSDFIVGDRVGIFSHVPCFECNNCTANFTNRCLNLNHIGFTLDGSAEQYVTLPAKAPSVTKIPKDLRSDFATIIEPIACVLHGVQKLFPKNGYLEFKNKNIVILGAGPIGVIWAIWAFLGKANSVVLVDPNKDPEIILSNVFLNDQSVSLIESFPKEVSVLADVLVLANSDPAAYEKALPSLASDASIICFAGLNGYAPEQQMDGSHSFILSEKEKSEVNPKLIAEVHYKEIIHSVKVSGKNIELVGSSGYTKYDIDKVLDQAATNPAMLSIFPRILTHELTLADAATVYNNFGSLTNLKNSTYDPKLSIKLSINPTRVGN